MEWLLYLLFPLMILFCLKRKFSRKKKRDPWNDDRPGEIIDFQLYVQNMQNQNKKLSDEFGKQQELENQKVIQFPKTNIK